MASDELATRLAAVEDRLAIIELEATYARLFDARQGDEWAALFTPDGVYQSRDGVPGGRGNYVEGRADLARFCCDAPFDGIHFLHLPQITFEGDSAVSRVHLEFVAAFHDRVSHSRRMVGYYDVSYQRVDGQWLISRRVTTTFSHEDSASFGYPETSGLPES